MSQYIITIVPVVEDGAVPVPQTMVRVETDGGRLAVKELTMRAPEGAGLVSGELPPVDFELLLRAFGGKPPGRRTVKAGGAEPGAARATGKNTLSGRGKGRKGNVARTDKGPLKAGRAYRRAPDAGALEEVYGQTGTIAGVAAHFGVPVHTAQGWITRLRRNAASAG